MNIILLLYNNPSVANNKFLRWEISPQTKERRATSAFKMRQGEENSSQIYQLALHKMTILPSNIPAFNSTETVIDSDVDKDVDIKNLTDTLTPPDKGKKRALSDSESNGSDNEPKKIRPFAEISEDQSDVDMSKSY